ncbi:Protein of unknown function [Pyronema omphalodes CBS 100304]|uniref:Uncharacterized protein n=1 Tax=Pyronema omphalodes (strain CBS 100304) TaxID=1076935 RepID=U4L5A3_PYROM|nr:Protein of unknown function [Pyronema omphalodes CBS 100304]
MPRRVISRNSNVFSNRAERRHMCSSSRQVTQMHEAEHR